MRRRLQLAAIGWIAGLAFVFVTGLPGRVSGQESSPPLDTRDAEPIAASRLEFGAHGSVLSILVPDALRLVGPGGRLTINITPRHAVELVADLATGSDYHGLFGLYFLQYKGIIRPGSRTRSAIFSTLAAGGSFAYSRTPEQRYQRPDGSTVVSPAYTHGAVSPPLIFGGGVGLERMVARRLAVRADVQALFAAGAFSVRGMAGVSVPLGGDRAQQ